jgi:hypothetical protein
MADFYERTYTNYEILAKTFMHWTLFEDSRANVSTMDYLKCNEVMQEAWFMGEEDSNPQQRPNTPCSPDQLKRLITEIGNLLEEA